MKLLIFLTVILTVLTMGGCPASSAQGSAALPDEADTPAVKGDGKPVLVELFTSEGCSSCPPADRLLAELSKEQKVKGAEAIALGFHVDYWDGSSWRDRFSSLESTKRQEAYAAAFKDGATYTPEMVVDGVKGFVGSNRGQAFNEIASRAAKPSGDIGLAVSSGKLTAKITGLADHSDSTIYLAVAEDDLTTQVGGGENSGEKLVHAAVVRDLKKIGSLTAKDSQFGIDTLLPSNPEWKTGHLRYVVFVQENSTLKVLAVNQTKN